MSHVRGSYGIFPQEISSTHDAPPTYQSLPERIDRIPDIHRRHTSTSSTAATEKGSLDFTQRIERKLAEYNASENVFKRWLFEILSWLVSASCMVAIVLLYAETKDQPVGKGTSFLTLANILGKVSSAALIVPTSEALGQLKWNWFNSSKAMWDFEIFDKASRGPLGALMLLYRTKGRSLAAMGALLILLLLAIDTFFQQVVDLPDRWTLHISRGVIPLTRYYVPRLPKIYQSGAEIAGDDLDFYFAINKFGYGNGTQEVPFGSGIRPEIALSCPTSNCTWPIYETLGVCSKCVDTPDLLEFACLNMRVDWTSDLKGGYGNEGSYPNATMCGHFINATSSNPILMSGYIADPQSPMNGEVALVRILPLTTTYDRTPYYGNGSINFKEYRSSITDILVVSAPGGSAEAVFRNETPVAQECILTWCVKTMQSKYSYGEYTEKVLHTFSNTTEGTWPWLSTPYETEYDNGTDVYFTEDIHLDPGPLLGSEDPSVFGTANHTVVPVLLGFNEFFPSITAALNVSDVPRLRYALYQSAPALTRLIDFNPWLAPNNVTRHMERLATTMTNVIRSAQSKQMLEGDAWNRETYISIRWAWLTFPFLLLILSLAFLVSTMIKTSKNTGIAVWKTSTMPTLIYSLPKEAQTEFNSSSTWNSGQHTKKVRIRLSGNTGWRVSGQGLRISSPRLPTAGRAPGGWI